MGLTDEALREDENTRDDSPLADLYPDLPPEARKNALSALDRYLSIIKAIWESAEAGKNKKAFPPERGS